MLKSVLKAELSSIQPSVVSNLGITLESTGSTIDYNSSKDLRFWDSTMDTMSLHAATSSAASMFPPATFIWEENFQDLSPFCQGTKDSDMATNRENHIGVPDDELNTPEIGQISEFEWFSKPVDDRHNDLDLPEKIWKYDTESFDTNYSCKDETQNCNAINVSTYTEMGSDVQKSLINTSVVTDEQVVTNISQVNELQSEAAADGGGNISNFNDTGIPSTYECSTKELQCEDIGDSSLVCAPEQVSVPRILHLNLSDRVPISDTLHTPDVLAPLVAVQDFDLVNFVLECSTPTQDSVESTPTNPAEIKQPEKLHFSDETKSSVVYQETFQEGDQSSCKYSHRETCKNSPSSASYIVVSPEDTPSSLRLIIKQEIPHDSQAQTRRSSRRKSSTGIKFKDSSDDESDDYEPVPVRRKKLTVCSKEPKSECSRYRELRNRNNEASRRSRINRKAREEEMKVQAAQLESDNARLRIRADELEKLVNTLRRALLNVMVKGKK